MDKEFVIRYSIPTKLDLAPYGTICRVIGDNNKSELFIQLGEGEPQWKRMGLFLESVFEDFLHDNGFVEECLQILKRKTTHPLQKIREMLGELENKA